MALYVFTIFYKTSRGLLEKGYLKKKKVIQGVNLGVKTLVQGPTRSYKQVWVHKVVSLSHKINLKKVEKIVGGGIGFYLKGFSVHFFKFFSMSKDLSFVQSKLPKKFPNPKMLELATKFPLMYSYNVFPYV